MSEADARRLHPASVVTGILGSIRNSILALLPIAGSFAFSDRPFVSVPVALAILAGIVLVPVLKWSRFRYAIGPDALVIESGVVARARRVIPFERIQDVDVERGPVARLTGTALVTVETGGAGKDEGTLDVVTLAEVERLRGALGRWRAGTGADRVGETAPADEPTERLLYRLPFSRVLLSGLLGFSLVSIAIIFGALQYAEPFTEGTRFDVQDRIGDLVNGLGDGRVDPRGAARAAGATATAAAVSMLVGAALVLGIVTGVVLAVLRDHGFRLTETAAGFRVRRGLLTIREVQIPRRRVQRVILKAPLPMRPFRLWRVELGTLGGATEAGGTHAVAPLARVAELSPLFDALGLRPAPQDWRRGHGLLVLQRFLPPLGMLLAAFAGLSVAFPPVLPLLLGALPIAGAAWLSWRGEKHALEHGALHVRTGIIACRHVIVPLARIQSVTVRRGPVERLIGLSRVIVDVAGASMVMPTTVAGLRPDDAMRLATALLAGRRRG